MPNRILKDSINESRALTSCSFFAQDLYKRLITYADDYGRFNADPEIILARLYPRELSIIDVDDVVDGIMELIGVKKIAIYTARPRHEIYGVFPNWKNHQRLRESKKKFPEPDNLDLNDWALRRFVPIEMKIKIIERDEFKCKICGKKIAEIDDARRLIKMGSGLFHIDHIVPCQQGGRATMENLQLTCPKCNLSRKRRFTFEEILQFAEQCGENEQDDASKKNSPQLAATCGDSRPESESEYESESLSKRVRAKTMINKSETEPLISEDEARKIQDDQNEILDKAEYVGMKPSKKDLDDLMNLMGTYGKDTVLYALDQASNHKAVNIAYISKICENYGSGLGPPGKGSQETFNWL